MRGGLAGLAVLGALWIGPAAGADLVVVEAFGTDVKPGQVLDDRETLTLREGQRVTLLTASGNVLKLRGPYQQAPAAGGGSEDASLSRALSAVLVQKEARTSDVGIVRAKVERVVLPEPWVIAVGRDGSFCVREGSAIEFWRMSAGKTASFSVMPLDRSWKLTATWSEGADRLKMPDGIPLQRRSTYLIDLDGIRSAITLSSIPAVVRTDAMRAGWMIEKGCEAQAEALLRTLR